MTSSSVAKSRSTAVDSVALLLVGNLDGTNVGRSLNSAAQDLGISCRVAEPRAAFEGPRWQRTLSWRLLGHRPPRLRGFSAAVVERCRQVRPAVVLTTGFAPLTRDALRAIRQTGAVAANYSTDDPWNVTSRSRWFTRALPGYDVIFTPRTANLEDFRRLGCRRVEHLPFAYDPQLFFPDPGPPSATPPADVLFVGGGDANRGPVLCKLTEAGIRLAVYGSYWERFRPLRPFLRGQVGPDALRRATSDAAISLCLVRRANRDGHVMRTFEIAACRACPLVEDTPEHRTILGNAAAYFSNADELVSQVRRLLADAELRTSLAAAAHARLTAGGNTYADRLRTILTVCRDRVA